MTRNDSFDSVAGGGDPRVYGTAILALWIIRSEIVRGLTTPLQSLSSIHRIPPVSNRYGFEADYEQREADGIVKPGDEASGTSYKKNIASSLAKLLIQCLSR